MALQMIPGGGLWMPTRERIVTSFTANALFDATGEKVAFIGSVWTPSGGAKSIRKLHFNFGGIVKAGGSALTVSLQDVDTTAGPVFRPDGTQDQTVAIANADANFATNTWYTTGNLSADRSVNDGDLLAVVFEFDGAGRLGADSVQLRTCLPGVQLSSPGVSFLASGTWTNSQTMPVLILEFSDGTLGTFDGAHAWSFLSNAGFNSGSAADEFALEFQVPWECQVDAAWIEMNPASNAADFDIVLYDGTTPMTNGTINVDANTLISLAASPFSRSFPGLVTLRANTTYRLALKPTTTNSVTYYFGDVANAAYLGVMDGGTTWCQASRVDAGAWTTTTTRRPWMGLHFVSFHDGSGSHFFGG